MRTEKDLGVTFTTDLKTAAHCKDVYFKANHVLDLLSRTIKYKNPAVPTTLYKSIVRPHLNIALPHGTHITESTGFHWKEYSITLHGCCLTSDDYHMKTGYFSWE